MKKIIVFTLTLLYLATGFSYAEIPKTMNYQGILKDSTGQIITGTKSITFTIYDDATAGNSLWTENHPTVDVSQGNFSVLLGTTTPLNLSFNIPYWLGITVGADSEMTPRQQLTSVGYAFHASIADSVPGAFTETDFHSLNQSNIQEINEVKIDLANTIFRLNSIQNASAYQLENLLIDTFADSTGIDDLISSNYEVRGANDYDLVVYHPIVYNSGDSYPVPTGVNSYLCWAVTNTDIFWAGMYYVKQVAQQFQVSQNCTLRKIEFYGDKKGTTESDIMVSVIQDSANNFGSTLGMSSISSTDISTSPSWNEIIFIDEITLNANQPYWILFNFENMGPAGNHVKLGANYAGTYPNGFIKRKQSMNNVWVDDPNADFLFKIHVAYSNSTDTASATSTRFIIDSGATEAIVIADESLNTGSINYFVSSNDGSSWNPCALNEPVSFPDTTGTNLRWKVNITGDAELNAIAVGF